MFWYVAELTVAPQQVCRRVGTSGSRGISKSSCSFAIYHLLCESEPWAVADVQDEIDALGSARSEDASHNGVLTSLLNEMDGIEELTGVTVVAATNRPDVLVSALFLWASRQS